jgi:hypothetical protein
VSSELNLEDKVISIGKIRRKDRAKREAWARFRFIIECGESK